VVLLVDGNVENVDFVVNLVVDIFLLFFKVLFVVARFFLLELLQLAL